MLSATNLCRNRGWAYFQARRIFAALRYMCMHYYGDRAHDDEVIFMF